MAKSLWVKAPLRMSALRSARVAVALSTVLVAPLVAALTLSLALEPSLELLEDRGSAGSHRVLLSRAAGFAIELRTVRLLVAAFGRFEVPVSPAVMLPSTAVSVRLSILLCPRTPEPPSPGLLMLPGAGCMLPAAPPI